MTLKPIVSVIIPTYNRAILLKETLESVFAQTYTDYEVVIIDDGSTDDTEEMLSALLAEHSEMQPKVRYIKQENAGEGAARNHGIFEARGKWVAFLDSDDLWFPDKLEKQMAFIAEHPSAAAVSCQGYSYRNGQVIRGENGEMICPWTRRETSVITTETLASWGGIWASTVIIRKTALYKAGLFEAGLKIGADYEYWFRVVRHVEFWHLNEIVGYYRHHDANISGNYFVNAPYDNLVRKMQIVRWSHEPQIVKLYEKWLCGYNSGIADMARKRRDYKVAARYFWLCVGYAHGWKLKSKFFAKFLLAKFFPFVFRWWDKRD